MRRKSSYWSREQSRIRDPEESLSEVLLRRLYDAIEEARLVEGRLKKD